MTDTYDNSKENPREANAIPRLVECGASSKDETLLFDIYGVEAKDSVEKSVHNG